MPIPDYVLAGLNGRGRPGYHDRSIEDHARTEVAALLGRLDDGDLDSGDSYAEDTPLCRRFMLAGNGPTVWLNVTYTEDGSVNEGILTYYEFSGGAACVVPSQYVADIVKALTS